MKKIISFALFLCLSVCSFLSICSENVFAAESISKKQWIEDINYMAKEFVKTHPKLEDEKTKDEFYNQINELIESVPNIDDEKINIGMRKIIAYLEDSHTDVHEAFENVFPIHVEWLKDGFYVKLTLEEYNQALYCKVAKIDGIEIKEISKLLETIIPHENSVVIKKRVQKYITSPELLYGLDIIDDKEVITFTFENQEGKQFDMDIEAIDIKSIKEMKFVGNQNKNIPLYMQNIKENYWFKYLSDSKAIYLKYNRCFAMKDKSIEEFIKEVFDVVDSNQVDKFIIDLRDNPGGKEGTMHPLFKEIIDRDHINKFHKLYVIVGQYTASSAAINSIQLQEYTNAIFVGEPTFTKPDHYGAISEFVLPNSKLEVTCSTKYAELSKIFKCVSEDDKSFMPDVIVENSIEDLINGRDAVLDSILRNQE
ncbi:S41 family peptidase [Oceanirhabdus seepicola]|uniref:Peptidase S41 n=1 Tax=Oceanirhabdus seepicola TaxID=2828781 RepID=A0A9J6P562_9CLOT|nr:S41 family peptidase [Oceanirhabdus seepicola]MCM1991831.1 peptidase S41 [Oceanirhabdus seepicola]